MVESLALILFSFIKKNKELNYDKEIYIYGLEIIISTILDIAVILLISLFLNQPIQALIFLAVFSFLRIFTGGYHAKTYWGCLLVLIFLYMTYTGFVIIIQPSYSMGVLTLLWSVSLFAVIRFAPLDDVNKPLNEREKRSFKKKSVILTFCLLIISIITFFIAKTISLAISVTVFEVVILMVIKLLRKEVRIDEKQ